jgi:hypothetical protein
VDLTGHLRKGLVLHPQGELGDRERVIGPGDGHAGGDHASPTILIFSRPTSATSPSNRVKTSSSSPTSSAGVDRREAA